MELPRIARALEHQAGDRTIADGGLPIARSRQRRRMQCYLVLLGADLVAILAGFALAGHFISAVTGISAALDDVAPVLAIFLVLALHNGSYTIATLQEAWSGIGRAVIALLIAIITSVFAQFLIRPRIELSPGMLSGGAVCAAFLIVVIRLQLRRFVRWNCGSHVINELIIDDGGPQLNFDGAFRVSASGMGLSPDLNNPAALDRFGLALRNIDRVVISCPPSRRAAWAMMLKGANVDGEVLADDVARFGAKGARVAENHGLLLVSAGPLGTRERAIKRAFDVAFAGSAILALSPLLIAVTLAVKLQDRGPVFFIQRRMGRGNRFFSMYKFRSMTHSLGDAHGNVSAARDDKRITPVGRLIRRTSIDELPQLFNVLLGDMSLVGPRPHATGSLAGDKLFWEVDQRYWQRHSLKPGLSGLAQVRGFRGATDHESDLIDRLQADLEYLEGWTIMRDIQIIFLTLRVLVHEKAF